MALALSSRPSCSRSIAARPQRQGRCRVVPVRAVLDVTEKDFEAQVLKSDKPVLVDFWAPWCGPCKLMAPMMDAVEKEFGDTIKVVKVEHGSSPSIIEQYKVYGLPALMFFKDGQKVEGTHNEGAIGKAALMEYVKKHLAGAAAAAAVPQ